MRSSTSSSERLPRLRWLTLLGVAGVAVGATIAIMETTLAVRGFQPSVLDSETRWLAERVRARRLGPHALVLVGASRMKLDVDQEVLRHMTGLEPVQLALDGTPFYPVFKGLAEDPQITGTILVDFSDAALVTSDGGDSGNRYERDAERAMHTSLPDFGDMETWLTDQWRGNLRSYADGASPGHTLRARILYAHVVPQYLTSRPDRSTLADYRQVPLPNFYYQRVSINLGLRGVIPEGTDAEVQDRFRRLIGQLKPYGDHLYGQRSAEVATLADAIRARGGRVIFVVFPESGYVRDIDDKRFPRPQFWDVFAASSRSQVLNFRDVPALAAFTCPDGSHLDYRDRESFTEALVRALRLDVRPP